MANKKLKWKSEFDKQVIIDSFTQRGWVKCSDKDEEDWNFFWATVWTVRNIFNPKMGIRLTDQQVINHFPNHYELTRKDLMVKNFKRFRKDLEKEGNQLAQRDENGTYIHLEFFPQTYVLPGEYSLFVEEFHRNQNTTWIVKPANRSQGKGIFLLRKIQQLKKISGGGNNPLQAFSMKENYVVSRYVDNPLLVGGKKFDLRLYVLVTSYKPLKVYFHEDGFARFCNEQYSSDIAEMDNMFIHLTNVAIQKFSDKYSGEHGGKWHINQLKYFIEMIYGLDAINRCFEEINNLIILTLKSVQSTINNDKHCFELYGYDILIDDKCKPWLIEINSSPSLSTTTKSDKQIKTQLLKDVINIVIPEDWGEDGKYGANTFKETECGGFSLLYDEVLEKEKLNGKGKGKQNDKNFKIWK